MVDLVGLRGNEYDKVGLSRIKVNLVGLRWIM